jgi:hypothetical protein
MIKGFGGDLSVEENADGSRTITVNGGKPLPRRM